LSGSAKKKDIVEAKNVAVEGVVSRVKEGSVTLSLRNDEEIPFSFETRCWLFVSLCVTAGVNGRVKLANEVTFKRMKDTMTRLQDTSQNELSSLSRILLAISEPTEPNEMKDIKFFDETLNDSQKDAVRFSLSVPELALIHGPPGVPPLHPPNLTRRPAKHTL
jgi:DNA polymerase alpha-associated DNA helicase A